MSQRRVIAIDFDGCLCEKAWPDIGAPNWDVINAAISEQKNGAALILWTCRVGDLLKAAVDWCKERGLEFDAVNENLPERLEYYGSESRKVSADEYWDDLAVHMPSPPNDPLTLEKLREMDGEPVWLKVDGADGYYVMFCGFDCDCKAAHFWNDFPRYLKNYGENWLAYRRKPNEGVPR